MFNNQRVILLAVSLILLATACLKLLGLDVFSASKVGTLSSPAIQSGAVAWETFLGLWLLSGVLRNSAWAFALATFVAFAAVSAGLTWIGVASCGCLGEIPVAPHWMLLLDGLVVAALIWKRPTATRRSLLAATSVAWASLASLGGLVLIGQQTGINAGIIHLILNTAIQVDDVVDYGTVEPGQILKKDVALKNGTASSVRLVGGTLDCSTMVAGATTTIAPGETATVSVNFRVARDAEPGLFSRGVEVWTDSPTQPVVRLRVVCSVALSR